MEEGGEGAQRDKLISHVQKFFLKGAPHRLHTSRSVYLPQRAANQAMKTVVHAALQHPDDIIKGRR